MNVFEQDICDIISKGLNSYDGSVECDPSMVAKFLERPPSSEMGDYAIPCFSFAKILKIPPVKIAKELVPQIQKFISSKNHIVSIEAEGAYINFRISVVAMAKSILPKVFCGNYFKEPSKNSLERVMIEYSQPNTHKGFHVGHLRNVALGDSLSRIFKYNGYDVVGVNYIGDVGTHIAKCLWFYKNFNK